MSDSIGRVGDHHEWDDDIRVIAKPEYSLNRVARLTLCHQ
jgi:hypothetical protein